jgi:guanylate kinase
MVYVISGPSGCGKSSLIERSLALLVDVRFSVSHTTRKKRRGEVEGKDYYFIDEDKFRNMVRRDAFIEWAVVHGAYYGTSRKELKKGASRDVVLDIDVQGARQVKDRVEGAVFIFVLPPSLDVLKERLQSRGQDSQAAIAERLRTARREVREYSRFDHVIINDRLDAAAEELASIVICHRTRRAAREKDIRPILASFRRG